MKRWTIALVCILAVGLLAHIVTAEPEGDGYVVLPSPSGSALNDSSIAPYLR